MKFVKVILSPDKTTGKVVYSEQEKFWLSKENDPCMVEYITNKYRTIQDVVIGYPGNLQIVASLEDGSYEIMDKHIGEELMGVILPNDNLRIYAADEVTKRDMERSGLV